MAWALAGAKMVQQHCPCMVSYVEARLTDSRVADTQTHV